MLPLIIGSQDCCHGVVELVKSTREWRSGDIH